MGALRRVGFKRKQRVKAVLLITLANNDFCTFDSGAITPNHKSSHPLPPSLQNVNQKIMDFRSTVSNSCIKPSRSRYHQL